MDQVEGESGDEGASGAQAGPSRNANRADPVDHGDGGNPVAQLQRQIHELGQRCENTPTLPGYSKVELGQFQESDPAIRGFRQFWDRQTRIEQHKHLSIFAHQSIGVLPPAT